MHLVFSSETALDISFIGAPKKTKKKNQILKQLFCIDFNQLRIILDDCFILVCTLKGPLYKLCLKNIIRGMALSMAFPEEGIKFIYL